jgi:hypothetical protein
MGTQWRIAAGMRGLVWLGLDYAAVPTVLRMLRSPRVDWPALFDGLRIMESAAARELNRKK